MKTGIIVLLSITLLFGSCKGEVKKGAENVKEQISDNYEEVKEEVSELAEDIRSGADNIENPVSEAESNISDTEEIKQDIESHEDKNIVAPSTKKKDTKPKPKRTTTTETTQANKGQAEEIEEDLKSNNSEVLDQEEIVESAENTSTSTKPAATKGNVLKEIDKQVDPAKEKVKVDKMTKPASSGGTSTKIENNQQDFGHSGFNSLLNKVVSSNGVVDYQLLQTSVSELNAYCKLLENNAPSGDWSKNERLAYWLNAYNAYTLKLIVDNYPLQSIMDLDGGKPWDKKWIKLDSKTLSLNDIEHEIIRPTFGDARIHFAVNCAAKSCPPLANFAFTGRNVNTKMEELTKKFINSSANEITADRIVISKIFDWYAKDFGNRIDFINKYSDIKIDPKAKVKFMDYDWRLNGK